MIIIALYFLFLSLGNRYEMLRFSKKPEIFDGPLVSVLIPMRNEEKNAQKCLDSLRNQLYKNYEILVLNDNSTDDTAVILEQIAIEDSRVKIFNGKALPEDWFGKPFALHQLSSHAKGDILLFTDADTVHSPKSISWAVTNMQNLKIDMLSGYIGQVFLTIGEIITVPIMFFLTGLIIPLFLNRVLKVHWFSAAVGQFIAIRHDVFREIGGAEAFKKNITEDIYMSRLVKKKGFSTRFLNICEYVHCRMYDGYRSAIEGIGKNMFDFLGKKSFVMLILFIGVFFFLFFPFLLFIVSLITAGSWLLQLGIVCFLYTLIWLLIFLEQRLNWWYGFLWPFIYLNLLYMSIWLFFRSITGKGFIWKDRKVN
ncbi:MAG: glycosyltransferase [Treponema sp.]|nr:glycosyltransferase [Treponema sp.]